MTTAQGHAGLTAPGDLPQPGRGRDPGVLAMVRLLACMAVGAAVGVSVGVSSTWRYGLLTSWMVAAAAFVSWMWLTIWSKDAASTARHAVREDPGRAVTDATIVLAALASLVAVGLLLLGGSSGAGNRDLQAVLSVGSVALAWAAVHTIFTTRYARLYYQGPDGGINFNQDQPPHYSDFAYVAFTIGMTFQVSDTDLQTKEIRATAMRHALLSFLFGAVIIATMINLVAGLSK